MSDTPMPAILRPADLAALGHWLRGAGMQIHPGQIIAANRLLTDSRHPPPPAELASWLAPVFCTNATEQKMFGQLYADWLRQADGIHFVGTVDTRTRPELPPPPPPPRRLGALLLRLLLVVVCVLTPASEKQAPSQAPPRPYVHEEVVPPSYGVADMQRIDGLAAPQTMTVKGPRSSASKPSNFALRTAGTLIMLGALVWWLYSAARRRGFLERLPADNSATRQHLATSATPALAAYASELRYLGRELRRRRSTPSRRLNIVATLAATVRAGGVPIPVFGSLGEPVYLMLVERDGAADHQAALSKEVVHLLHVQGVALERYEFDRDPRFSRHAPLEGMPLYPGTQSLDALHARHPDARLIIFSDGDGLIDQYTGLPAAWVGSLLAWPNSVLITPQPDRLWTRREWALVQAGLTVLPLNADGLRSMSQFLRKQTPTRSTDYGARNRTRPSYLRDVDLLLDRRPLDQETLTRLMADLERDLGSGVLVWLAACAVYPEIHWAITLAVGDSIAPKRSRGHHYAERLAQISRLPWMRVGFMPDWFRSALLARLSPEAEQAVRAALDNFLAALSISDRPTGTALEIAIEPRLRAWNDVIAGLRAWKRRHPQTDTRKDAIFLRFMSGPRKALMVDAGTVLTRLLYRDGSPLGGPRSWVPIAALALTTAAFLLAKATQSVDTKVTPIPLMIGLSPQGDRIAMIDNVGTIAIKPIQRSNAKAVPACNVTFPLGKPLWLSAEGIVSVGQTGKNGVQGGWIRGQCAEGPIYEVPPLEKIIGDRTGRLSLGKLAQNDVKAADILCTKVRVPRVLLAERLTIEAVLPAEARPAVTCAFAEDASSLLVATKRGKLFEYALGKSLAVPVDRGSLPPSTGASYALATNRLGGDIALASTSGDALLKRSGQDWSRLDIRNARPPLAISEQGDTLAFATAQRDVAIWRTLPPSTATPTVTSTTASTVMPAVPAKGKDRVTQSKRKKKTNAKSGRQRPSNAQPGAATTESTPSRNASESGSDASPTVSTAGMVNQFGGGMGSVEKTSPKPLRRQKAKKNPKQNKTEISPLTNARGN